MATNATIPVIFRKFKEGDIIALFPTLQSSPDKWTTCESYQHIGQHGAASIFLTKDTVTALPHEYTPLLNELISIGYKLKIYKRWQHKFDIERYK